MQLICRALQVQFLFLHEQLVCACRPRYWCYEWTVGQCVESPKVSLAWGGRRGSELKCVPPLKLGCICMKTMVNYESPIVDGNFQ